MNDFASADFDRAAYRAGHNAFSATLAHGLPVFYLDSEGVNVMELPDGRRFEICWIPNAEPGENFHVVRELKARAA